jgi:hypothetical protein
MRYTMLMHKRNGTDSGRLSTSVTLYDIDSPTISVRIIELATPADWLIAGIAHATATEASGCRDGNDYLRPQRRMSGPSSPPRLTLGQIATRRVTHT